MLRAAQKNWVPIMHLLVEHGMQVQGAAYTDGSPLAMAIQHNSLEAVQWLLQQGAQADREALVKALHSRAFRCVQPLLQHGVRDTDDRALYTAAQLGSLEAVQLLLSAAANSPEGVPDSAAQVELVLCGAASMGQLGIVQWLLGREASPPEAGAAASPRPSTHLRHHCTPAVLTKALEALILGSEFRYVHPSWGWEQEGPPWGYGSYRDPFSQQDLQALARLLLESGADLDADSGRLVLMAISGSEYSLVRQLCEASPGPVVTSGLALHAAQVAHDTQAFVSLLPLTDLSRADTNAALLFAVQRRCIQQVCALLMWGADANCYGGAPLSAAIQQHSNEVAALLLQHGAQPDASQVQRLVAFAGPQLLHLLEARSLMPSSMARPGLV
jgi:ankyrin repeat protein